MFRKIQVGRKQFFKQMVDASSSNFKNHVKRTLEKAWSYCFLGTSDFIEGNH